MNLFLGIIVGILVLAFLVVIHEAGHAWAARKNGVVVEEFAIGFPPTLWKTTTKSGVEVKLNSVPLGGYVKLQGEHDAASGKGDYGNASLAAKTKILFAGIAMNLLAGVVLFTILAWIGLPKIFENQFGVAGDTKEVAGPVMAIGVSQNSPALKAGVAVNDQVLQINEREIVSPQQLVNTTKELAGQEVEIKLISKGETSPKLVKAKLNHFDSDEARQQGVLGVAPGQETKFYSTWSAPIVGVGTTVQLAIETLRGVGTALVNLGAGLAQKVNFNPEVRDRGQAQLNQAGDAVAGPIALLGVIFPSLISAEPQTFLLFVAAISVSLAVMNVLPIPGLDGGRWLVTMIYRLRKKVLTKEAEEKINATGIMFLLALAVVVAAADLFKLFK